MTRPTAGPGPEGPRNRWRLEMLARTIESFAPRGSLLDTGCGRGRLARRLADSGWVVYGTDLAARWLDVPPASSDAEGAAIPPARDDSGAGGSAIAASHSARAPYWALASAGAAPWRDEEFRAVAMGEVLEHVEDDRAVVAEVARILEPGGVLVITVPAGPGRMGASDERAGHFRRYDRRALRELLSEGGLEVELIRGWGGPIGRLYERLAYRTEPGPAARRAASGRAARALERLFGFEGRWDSGDYGCGLLAVARRPMA